MTDAFIYQALRSPIGKFGGAYAHARPDDLAAHLIKSVVERSQIDAQQIDDVIIGCANQAGEDTRNVARLAALLAGLPVTVPGMTINRLCASGLQAVISAAQAIKAGAGDLFIAGGVESMTRAPYVMLKSDDRWTQDAPEVADSTIGWRFTNPKLDPKWTIRFAETAELVAQQYGITRATQDEYALHSHVKAVEATRAGKFDDELIATESLAHDEVPRAHLRMEALQRAPAISHSGGTITAGNSGSFGDGAAALLIGSPILSTDKRRTTPLARIVDSAVFGVDPAAMGLGPIPAIRKITERSGVPLQEIGVIELNEAFAATTIACIRDLELDNTLVNVNGGAIALGYPLGCAGARLVVTLVHEMKRRDARYGLAATCTAVGQGAALLLERP